jgi:hypothetical protein
MNNLVARIPWTSGRVAQVVEGLLSKHEAPSSEKKFPEYHGPCNWSQWPKDSLVKYLEIVPFLFQ